MFKAVTKDATEMARQETFLEMQALKERLAQDGAPLNLKSLQHAFMMPPEVQRNPGEVNYPRYSDGMTKKKGKKKKGKKGGRKKK